jgi:hypothetical protein
MGSLFLVVFTTGLSLSQYVHCFVKSFGWYESEDSVFIAMEYLEHGDLRKFLRKPFPEGEAKDIAIQLVEGLSFMHDNGFAHRDLKPEVCDYSPPLYPFFSQRYRTSWFSNQVRIGGSRSATLASASAPKKRIRLPFALSLAHAATSPPSSSSCFRPTMPA